MKKLLILLPLALAGCVTTGQEPVTNIKPICEALIGPIEYSSTNPKSTRFAAKDLAPDLAARNRVGQLLTCPAYN